MGTRTTRNRWRWFLPPGLVLLAALSLELASRYSAPQPIGEVIKRVETAERLVALTFDDGPKQPYTAQLLRVLAEQDVRATFFVTGRQASLHPELVRATCDAGHGVGNHTWSHPRIVWHLPSMVRSELARTDAAIRAAGCSGEIPFRSPYGRKGVALWWVLAEQQRSNVLFDVMPADYLRPPAEAIVGQVLAEVRPGSIVVLHDGGGDRSATVAAVDALIPALRQRGYRIVTVAELVAGARLDGVDGRLAGR